MDNQQHFLSLQSTEPTKNISNRNKFDFYPNTFPDEEPGLKFTDCWGSNTDDYGNDSRGRILCTDSVEDVLAYKIVLFYMICILNVTLPPPLTIFPKKCGTGTSGNNGIRPHSTRIFIIASHRCLAPGRMSGKNPETAKVYP